MQATAASEQASEAALARDLFAVLGHLARATMPNMFRVLGELDLGLTQVKLLHALEDADSELSLKELAERLSLSLPAASRAIDALHHRGFVHRREDEHDRRMKRVRIAASGSQVLRKLNRCRMAHLAAT